MWLKQGDCAPASPAFSARGAGLGGGAWGGRGLPRASVGARLRSPAAQSEALFLAPRVPGDVRCGGDRAGPSLKAVTRSCFPRDAVTTSRAPQNASAYVHLRPFSLGTKGWGRGDGS